MAKLTMNIDKLIANGEELKGIANEYNKLIDETYKKLQKVSEDGVFASENENGAANVFIRSAEADKKNVTQVGNSIYTLGDKIVNYANNIKSVSNDTIGG